MKNVAITLPGNFDLGKVRSWCQRFYLKLKNKQNINAITYWYMWWEKLSLMAVKNLPQSKLHIEEQSKHQKFSNILFQLVYPHLFSVFSFTKKENATKTFLCHTIITLWIFRSFCKIVLSVTREIISKRRISLILMYIEAADHRLLSVLPWYKRESIETKNNYCMNANHWHFSAYYHLKNCMNSHF